MAVPEVTGRVERSTRATARPLTSDICEELLAIMCELFNRNVFAERLAYSPEEAAEPLGISRELIHDLLRTGQLGSVKAGRRLQALKGQGLSLGWRFRFEGEPGLGE